MNLVCSACESAWCNCCHWTCGGQPVRVEPVSVESRLQALETLVRKLCVVAGATALGMQA